MAVEKHKAKNGSIVVLDAKTGEVLALANWPSYNPNNRDKPGVSVLRNRAVTDEYEPGSTMKPFTIATALDAGKIKPNTVINTAGGVFTRERTDHTRHPPGSRAHDNADHPEIQQRRRRQDRTQFAAGDAVEQR